MDLFRSRFDKYYEKRTSYETTLPKPVDFVSPTGRDIEVFAQLPMEILRRIVLMAQVFIRGIRVPRPPPIQIGSFRSYGYRRRDGPWDISDVQVMHVWT